MNKRVSRIAILMLVVGLLLIAPKAFAVLTTDNTNIGQLSPYGSTYSAFWRTGHDYSVLTDGNYSYFNAPGAAGSLIFRRNNSCYTCITAPDGVSSMGYLDQLSNFVVAGSMSVAATSSGSASFYADKSKIVLSNASSTAVFYVDSSGDLTITGIAGKPGGGTWGATSDARAKKNERPYTTGLAALNRIKPIWYQYNGKAGMPDDGHDYVGVNAQDLEPVAPSMVTTFGEGLPGGVKHVDASEFTYMLINAVQALDARVKALESRCK